MAKFKRCIAKMLQWKRGKKVVDLLVEEITTLPHVCISGVRRSFLTGHEQFRGVLFRPASSKFSSSAERSYLATFSGPQEMFLPFLNAIRKVSTKNGFSGASSPSLLKSYASKWRLDFLWPVKNGYSKNYQRGN